MTAPVSPEERAAALRWLDAAAGLYMTETNVPSAEIAAHAATIRRLLAQPTLPEEPTWAMLGTMSSAWLDCPPNGDAWPKVYRALYAHLTKPATREVEVYHVEFWDEQPHVNIRTCRETAEYRANELRRGGSARCIRVTGPHRQEFPA